MKNSINLSVVYSDEYLAIVDKPEKLPVNKNSHMPHDADYLNKLASQYFDRNIFNPHRLDAKTSGLIILCFDKETTEKVNAMFRDKKILKTYHAVVKGDLPENMEINNPVFDRKKRKKLKAKTEFELIKKIETGRKDKFGDDLYLNLIKIKIDTGRWHQIRQHLSSLKYDIIGDTQHGDWDLNKEITGETGINRLFLHASELEFQHPVNNETLTLRSDLPESFTKILNFNKSL